MAASKSTELATIDGAGFLALNKTSQEIAEILQDSLAGQDVGEFDLPRITIPAGGGRTWEVPTFGGVESTQVLDGILVYSKRTRAYWPDKETSGEPPACRSNDALTGVGKPGGDCRSCPLGNFTDGEPPACKEKEVWFLLRDGSLLPIVLSLPATSLKAAKRYRIQLASAGISPRAVVTEISLEPDKNPDGQAYSRAVLKVGAILDPKAAEQARAYADLLRPIFDRTANAVAVDNGTGAPVTPIDDAIVDAIAEEFDATEVE
jgi:hypothetical protein